MIVLCFRCEIVSYHIITFSLVMCLVHVLAFCLEITDFLEELTENEYGLYCTRNQSCDNQKGICKLTPLME